MVDKGSQLLQSTSIHAFMAGACLTPFAACNSVASPRPHQGPRPWSGKQLIPYRHTHACHLPHAPG